MTDEEILTILHRMVDEDGRDHDDYLRLKFSQRFAISEAIERLAEVERLRGWRDVAEEHLSNQLALERENAALREIAQAGATADLHPVSLSNAQRPIPEAPAPLPRET